MTRAKGRNNLPSRAGPRNVGPALTANPMEVLIYPDPVLRRGGQPITAFDQELAELMEIHTGAAHTGVLIQGLDKQRSVTRGSTHRGQYPGAGHTGVSIQGLDTQG